MTVLGCILPRNRGCWLIVALGLLGCRAHLPLAQTRPSPESVAREVMRRLQARDLPGLRSLAVNEQEFREVVWPRLPASRPERNLPWSFVWADLRGKSDAHLRALVARTGGVGSESALLSVTFQGESSDYGTFRVHRKTVLRLRDRAGGESERRLFGSLLEMGGRYKVFSYVVE